MQTIQIDCKRSGLVEKTEALLRERGASLAGGVILQLDSGIGTEGFRIEAAGPATVRIIGNDERGLLYGAGKHLRDRAWRGTSVPEKPIRAIYFATHFHNFYHDAPVAEVVRYIEDLALWGCNTLTVWFDMHHYTGIDDPAAQDMVARLRVMLEAAEAVGMRPGLMLLANESYSTSPEALRADWTAGHDGYFAEPGGHYHVEICPNQPGGLDLILRWRSEMLDAFAGIRLGFLVIWPYDQGGCTCSRCAPWGPNGFLKVAEPLARLLRQRFPQAALVLSTWYFDRFVKGEWEGLDRAFTARPEWVDYLMADDYGRFPDYPLQHGIPGGLPALSFPEISMEKMGPWGAFGANPRPVHWQRYWETVRDHLSGSFPYSEGIFEDLNKVLHLQLNWASHRSTREICREYAAAEFAPEFADEIVEAMVAMESTLEHGVDSAALRVALTAPMTPRLQAKGWPAVYHLPKIQNPGRYAGVLRRIDAKLSPVARKAWRWRILLLRALLDEELHDAGGRPTEKSDAYFEELSAIYHADEAEWVVSPLSRRALTRFRPQFSAPTGDPLPVALLTRWHSPFVTTWRVSRLVPKTVAGATAVRLADPLDWEIMAAGPSPTGFVSIHPRFGSEDGMVYLGNRFRVSRKGEWILRLGHDGGVRVFVNGRAVLTVPERVNPAPVFRSRVRLKLEPGTHEIVVALDTAQGNGWGIFCCFELPKSARKQGQRPVFPKPVMKRAGSKQGR